MLKVRLKINSKFSNSFVLTGQNVHRSTEMDSATRCLQGGAYTEMLLMNKHLQKLDNVSANLCGHIIRWLYSLTIPSNQFMVKQCETLFYQINFVDKKAKLKTYLISKTNYDICHAGSTCQGFQMTFFPSASSTFPINFRTK